MKERLIGQIVQGALWGMLSLCVVCVALELLYGRPVAPVWGWVLGGVGLGGGLRGVGCGGGGRRQGVRHGFGGARPPRGRLGGPAAARWRGDGR